MGLFKKRVDPAEVAELKSEISLMAARIEAADNAKHQLGRQVDGIVARLDAPITAPPITAPPTTPPQAAPAGVDQAEIDKLNARLERLSRRLDEVDQRITSISTELANQISEITNDLDGLGSREHPDEELLESLRDAQTRLANEQARYQIAFRQDLADLANRLRG